MHRFTRKSSYTPNRKYGGRHRFEHWYRDNQVYFITARCRDKFRAFESDEAKRVFFDRFDYYANLHGFDAWVTTLLDNHYHTVGYLHKGDQLGEMMRKLRGSVAKLVNDILPERRVPFWHDRRHHDYFDGCLRDVDQLRRSYRYTLTQATRSGIRTHAVLYPFTVVRAEREACVKFAIERRALLGGVPYKRYRR